MRFSAVAIISALAAVASAATPADTSKPPSGNPIALPGLDEQVPVGKPYTITWDATTPGKVSIILLRGPSNNVVPIATLADAVPNSGEFVWTPASSLEGDVSHYGLQIVVEGTGQYQYSTQFGIKNDDGQYTTDVPEPTSEPTYPTDVPEPTYPTDVPEPTYSTDAPEPTYSTEAPEPTYSSEVPEPTYTSEVPEPTYTTEPTYPTEPTDAPEPTYPEPTDAEPTYPAPTYTWITVSVPTPPASSTVSATPIPPASSTPVPTYSTGPAPPTFTGAAGRNSAASLSGAAVAGLVALFAL